jgi:hypothetical protein
MRHQVILACRWRKYTVNEIDLTRTGTPLCVDLDGTLLRSDTFYEFLALGLHHPLVLLRAIFWLARGKAYLKAQLAAHLRLDVSILPFNPEVIELLKKARTEGRRVVLATGSDQKVAAQINDYLGLFDEILASDGIRNLTGRRKADALIARFGAHGFSYAGNEHSDIVVWRSACSAILVGANSRVEKQVRGLVPVEAAFPSEGSTVALLLPLLRPYQWYKNLLVFVPILIANAILEWLPWLRCLAVFGAFSLMASVLCVFNDIFDLEADRRHPGKRHRPLASGEGSLKLAYILVPPGCVLAFAAAIASHAPSLVLLYGVASFAYSFWFKKLPWIDLFIGPGAGTLRILAGASASGHKVSVWLLAGAAFFFFSLAAIRRVAESKSPRVPGPASSGRGYLRDDELP